MTFQTLVWILVGISMVLALIAQVLWRRHKPRRGQGAKETKDSRLAVTDTEPSRSPSEPDDRSPPIIEFDSFAQPVDSDHYDVYQVNDLARREQSVFSQDSFELIDAGVTSVKPTENMAAAAESESLMAAADRKPEQTPSWISEYSSASGHLDESARLKFLSVLESTGTSRAVNAIANAGVNDPSILIRVEALRALARLINDDGELWVTCAAEAARSVIAQRQMGGEDVKRARSLKATIDVIQFEAQACESQ